MFNSGGQQHQQQAQNVPSDSSNYRAQYARSQCDKYLCPDTLGGQPLPPVSMPWLTSGWSNSMRALSPPLPLRVAVPRGQVRARRRAADMHFEGRLQGRRGGEEGRASAQGPVVTVRPYITCPRSYTL
jgi:hypothetical protein